jgi:hypothetical protein
MGLKRLETMYGISEEAIESHASMCIPEMLERAKALSTVRRAVDGIPELFAEVRDLLFQAKAARDFPTWAAAIQRLERALNLLSKLTGEAQGPSTWERILQSREWAAVREAHDRALARYPDAAAALKAELLKAAAA